MRKHINTLIWGVGVCGALEQGTETYLCSPVCTLMGWGPSWRKELNQGVISAIRTPPTPAPAPQLWSLPACPAGCWQKISALRFAQPRFQSSSVPDLGCPWTPLPFSEPASPSVVWGWRRPCGHETRSCSLWGPENCTFISGREVPGVLGNDPPPRGQPEALKQQMGLPTAQPGCKSSRTT